MDFSTFVITGPNTLTASIFYNLLGSIAAASALKIGQTASLATNCQTDTFTVTGSGGYAPPVICGTNTGYHSMLDFLKSLYHLNVCFLERKFQALIDFLKTLKKEDKTL
jgi:hypothetical protein